MASTVLTLAEIQAYDPMAAHLGDVHGNVHYCCPLPACSGHRVDAAHRSLSVDRANGKWYCHRCKGGGTLKEFWSHKPAVWVPTAKRRAAEQRRKATEVTPPPRTAPPASIDDDSITIDTRTRAHVPLGDDSAVDARAYIAKRGLDPDLVEKCGAFYCPDWAFWKDDTQFDIAPHWRQALVFPLHGAGNTVVAAQGDLMRDGLEPKKHSMGPLKDGVFATPGALESRTLIVTEAIVDAITLAQCGFPAIALCGTSLRDFVIIRFFGRRIFLAFDADEAGDHAYEEWRTAGLPRTRNIERLRPEGAKDWNQHLLEYGRNALTTWLRSRICPGESNVEDCNPVPEINSQQQELPFPELPKRGLHPDDIRWNHIGTPTDPEDDDPDAIYIKRPQYSYPIRIFATFEEAEQWNRPGRVSHVNAEMLRTLREERGCQRPLFKLQQLRL